LFEFFKKTAIEKSGVSNHLWLCPIKDRTKVQRDKSYEGETEFNTRKSFRDNSCFVITDSLLSELDKRRLAYEIHNAVFGFLLKLAEIEPLEMLACAKKSATFYQYD
jgi:hypothetical protein